MTDIFNDVTPSVDDTKDYLTEFVGDDKKYKTPAELAKAKAHADAHIERITREQRELREELNKRITTEEMLDKITQLSNRSEDKVRQPDPQAQPEVKSGMTKEEVERLLADRDNQFQANSNLTSAVNKLTEMYGTETAAEIDKKASELNVNKEYLKNLAKTSPAVFTALFTPKAPVAKDVFGAPVVGKQVNGNSSSEKYSDFQKIKREDPKRYFGKEVQAQILKAADRAAAAGRYDEWKNS